MACNSSFALPILNSSIYKTWSPRISSASLKTVQWSASTFLWHHSSPYPLSNVFSELTAGWKPKCLWIQCHMNDPKTSCIGQFLYHSYFLYTRTWPWIIHLAYVFFTIFIGEHYDPDILHFRQFPTTWRMPSGFHFLPVSSTFGFNVSFHFTLSYLETFHFALEMFMTSHVRNWGPNKQYNSAKTFHCITALKTDEI